MGGRGEVHSHLVNRCMHKCMYIVFTVCIEWRDVQYNRTRSGSLDRAGRRITRAPACPRVQSAPSRPPRGFYPSTGPHLRARWAAHSPEKHQSGPCACARVFESVRRGWSGTFGHGGRVDPSARQTPAHGFCRTQSASPLAQCLRPGPSGRLGDPTVWRVARSRRGVVRPGRLRRRRSCSASIGRAAAAGSPCRLRRSCGSN